jgi:hypothetical protein
LGFDLGQHKWLRLLLLTLLLYVALLPVWWVALNGLTWLMATGADFFYHLLDSQVTMHPEGKVIRVLVASPGRAASDPYQLPLRLDTISYGLPLLAALVLVTRADSLKAKARALLIGLGVMLLFTLLAVMLWARLASLQAEAQLAQATVSDGSNRVAFFYFVFHGYAFSQPVASIAVWFGLLFLGIFKAPPPKEATPAVARNAPCPCGSGRKYKRCCNRKLKIKN